MLMKGDGEVFRAAAFESVVDDSASTVCFSVEIK